MNYISIKMLIAKLSIYLASFLSIMLSMLEFAAAQDIVRSLSYKYINEIKANHDLLYVINGEITQDFFILLAESTKNGDLLVNVDGQEFACSLKKDIATRCEIPFSKSKNYQPEAKISYNFIFRSASYYEASSKIGEEGQGSFTILPAHDSKWSRAPKIANISCNDVVRDYSHNLSVWRELENQERDITFHLGDQIYGDRIKYLMHDDDFDAALSWRVPEESEDQEKIYSRYKDLYILTYHKIQKSLRIGANIMMPDDHEFFDGAGTRGYYDLYNRVEDVKAAFRALTDYQLSLRADYQTNKNIYITRRWGDLLYIGIDFRIDRFPRMYKNAIYADAKKYEDYPVWISNQQLEWIKNTIENNKDAKYLIASTATQYAPSSLWFTNLLGYFSSDYKEGYCHENSLKECKSLLYTFMHGPIQKVLMINGDTHKASLATWEGENKRKLLECSSSAITRKSRGRVEISSIDFIATWLADSIFKGSGRDGFKESSELLTVGNNAMIIQLEEKKIVVNTYAMAPFSYTEALFMQLGFKQDPGKVKVLTHELKF